MGRFEAPTIFDIFEDDRQRWEKCTSQRHTPWRLPVFSRPWGEATGHRGPAKDQGLLLGKSGSSPEKTMNAAVVRIREPNDPNLISSDCCFQFETLVVQLSRFYVASRLEFGFFLWVVSIFTSDSPMKND